MLTARPDPSAAHSRTNVDLIAAIRAACCRWHTMLLETRAALPMAHKAAENSRPKQPLALGACDERAIGSAQR